MCYVVESLRWFVFYGRHSFFSLQGAPCFVYFYHRCLYYPIFIGFFCFVCLNFWINVNSTHCRFCKLRKFSLFKLKFFHFYFFFWQKCENPPCFHYIFLFHLSFFLDSVKTNKQTNKTKLFSSPPKMVVNGFFLNSCLYSCFEPPIVDFKFYFCN